MVAICCGLLPLSDSNVTVVPRRSDGEEEKPYTYGWGNQQGTQTTAGTKLNKASSHRVLSCPDLWPLRTQVPNGLRVVQAVGRIVANPHLGGLHHQYVRI
jgi:hypothetical protein